MKKHQHQYVICHGKLRTILAGYTGIAPEKICFAQEAFGKPYIIVEDQPYEIKFNLSHSGNTMLVAVGFHKSIGIDVEMWMKGSMVPQWSRTALPNPRDHFGKRCRILKEQQSFISSGPGKKVLSRRSARELHWEFLRLLHPSMRQPVLYRYLMVTVRRVTGNCLI